MAKRKPSKRSLTHVDGKGAARMVDVGAKPVTRRRARAEAMVRVSGELAAAIRANGLAKGDVVAAARLAGIAAAKRTDEWIPLCHTLPLEAVHVEVAVEDGGEAGRAIVRITTEAVTEAKTGVEMEALTAAAAAALTVYDMGKAMDRGMVIERVRLLEKSGGRSGNWRAEDD